MFVITLVLFALFYLNVINYTEDVLAIIILVQVLIIILPIFIVEKAIKDKKYE